MSDLFGEPDAIVIVLPQDRWDILTELVKRPDGKHLNGGYQDRQADWREGMNYRSRSIRLLRVRRRPRQIDDVSHIRRQIANKHGGGWQHHVHDIFVNTHLFFTGIEILPRPSTLRVRLRRRHPDDEGAAP